MDTRRPSSGPATQSRGQAYLKEQGVEYSKRKGLEHVPLGDPEQLRKDGFDRHLKRIEELVSRRKKKPAPRDSGE
jgi:hypothetical protein